MTEVSFRAVSAAGPGLQRTVWSRYSAYLHSLAAQGLQSGFHFALNVFLLRFLAPYDYGIYALSFILALLAGGIINALTSTPLSIFTAGVSRRVPRLALENTLTTVNSILILALLVLGALSLPLTTLSAAEHLASLLFVASYAARSYSRNFGYARQRAEVPLRGDMAYVGSSALVLLLLHHWMAALSVTSVLLALSFGLILAMLVELGALVSGTRLSLGWRSFARYRPMWQQSRWTLLGTVTTVLAAQAHSFIVSAAKGPEVFAPLAAGAVIFAPLRLALQAIQNVIRPKLVVAVTHQQFGYVRRYLRLSSLVLLGAMLLLAALIYVAWPWIYQMLFARQYAGAPMSLIVMFWVAIIALGALTTIPSTILQTLHAFRPLALVTTYSAVFSVLGVLVLLAMFPPVYSLAAVTLAEALTLVSILFLLRQRMEHLK